MPRGLAARVLRGRLLACFVACVGAMAGLAAQAHAQSEAPDLVESVGKVVDATGETAARAVPEAGRLLSGEQDVLDTVSTLLCPPVDAVDQLIRDHLGEPLGSVSAGLSSLVCSAGLLDFRFYTQWKRDDGQTVGRVHRAVVGVPTPLDVDDDPEPDLIGQITIQGSNELALVVVRAAGEASQLPVPVEGVVSDSTGRTIGRDHLAFGYDARHDRAPDQWEIHTPIDSLLEPGGEYRIEMNQQGRGQSIALIGAIFDGRIEQRTDPTEVRLLYGASPDRAVIRARVDEGVDVTLTQNRAGPAEISARQVSGGKQDRFLVEIQDLPLSLQLEVSPDQSKIVYDASAPVNRLAATFDTADPVFLGAQHLEATLLQVPQSFEMGLGRDGDGFALTSSQAIGQVDMRARSEGREFPQIPDGESGAVIDATANELAMALRVFGLRKVAASFDPITLETEMEGGRVFTVDAKLQQESGPLQARAVIDKMPSALRLAIESETGKVSYSASDRVDRISAEVDTAQPVLLGAGHVDVTFLDVPQAFELGIGQDAQSLSLSADEPIGQIDLRARSENRDYPEVPEGEAGAILDATGGELALALRVFKLELLDVSLDPIGVHAKMEGGRVFSIDAKLEPEGGPLAIRAVLDKLPSEVRLGLDTETGQVTYQGSDRMDRLTAQVDTSEPIFLGARHVDAQFLDVPESFSLGLGSELDNISLVSDQPIGQIDLRARSENRDYPDVPEGEAGAILDGTDGELGLALRVFELERLEVSLDPIKLEGKMAGGRVFTIDVKLDAEETEPEPLGFLDLGPIVEGLLEGPGEGVGIAQEEEPEDPCADAGNGGGGGGGGGGGSEEPAGPIHVSGVIDRMPSEVSLSLADIEPPTCGTRLSLEGSEPIDVVTLNADGVELLEGADSIKAEINAVPTELEVDLPQEGPLAKITANDHIGQLRLGAAADDAELPERSIAGDPVLNDLFRFKNLVDDFAIGLRLSAVKGLSVTLDPVNLTLDQDAARTRPVDLDAGFPSGDDVVTVAGLLNKPGTTTSMSVDLTPDKPAKLVFDNSHNMQRFELNATGLSGISEVDMDFDNLSKKMSICMDPGPACQRTNPHSVARYNTPQTTGASMDFDDEGSHGVGNGAAFRTTLNATIAFEAGDPVRITNLRFRNLGFDFQDSNNPHRNLCGEAPRISMFFDSRGHPFVINSLRYPPAIQQFIVGTDTQPARARNRIARVNGWGFACLGFSTQSAGALDCGGARNLTVNTALGNINVLNFLGFQLIPVCGGTVSNPQPW